MTIGEALLGFLKYHCTVKHEHVVFDLDGTVSPRFGNVGLEDELCILMPGPYTVNCAAGFRSLPLLKDIFWHAHNLLVAGKPLRQVLSSHKHKFIKVEGPMERFGPSDSIYIGGLHPDASEADVSSLIESVLHRPPHRVLIRQKSPQSSKHSFIWVGDVKSATRCVYALNGKPLDGGRICVNYAAPSKTQTDRPTIPPPSPQISIHSANATQDYCSKENSWYQPHVAPFPMVMVPVYSGYPERGVPLSMPFCMPPPEYNNLEMCEENLLPKYAEQKEMAEETPNSTGERSNWNGHDRFGYGTMCYSSNHNNGRNLVWDSFDSNASTLSNKSSFSSDDCSSDDASKEIRSEGSSDDGESDEESNKTKHSLNGIATNASKSKERGSAHVDAKGTATLKLLMGL